MDYATCRQAIASTLSPTATESVSLQEGLTRVTAKDLFAKVPQPEFTQSMRDGYVVSYRENDTKELCIYSVAGVIQAGNTTALSLAPGQASRIMTGGMIPNGGSRVFAQEECTVEETTLSISPEAQNRSDSYIQKCGSQIAIDQKIVSAGSVITPDILSLLAAVGHQHLEVYQKPQVGYFCSGSELVDSVAELHPGLKICSNRHLLEGSIKQAGGEPIYLGTVTDTDDKIREMFSKIAESDFDVVISTGGMGPGKYDLIEQCFCECSGKVIYNRLNLIPGKNSLFGTIARTLFFGLPGPPNAVRALMNSIVGPTLLELQGLSTLYPQTIEAQLCDSISRRRSGMMQLTAASLFFEHGKCLVKSVNKHDSVTCYVVFPPDKLCFSAGETVNIHLIVSPLSLSSF